MESDLEIEQETEGLITEISSDKGFVSIDVNGTTKTLRFRKSFLYTFGQQCDGDMTNILEEGMEVNVSYKYSQIQDKVSVRAVWVGEKPDFPSQLLDDVYNQKGIVDKILDDGSFLVRVDGLDLTVVVCLNVVYSDGCLLEKDQRPVITGDMITFDAVPNGAEPPEATYHATCAWIGREPPLAERFKLSVLNSYAQDLETLTGDCLYGIVIAIPNDTVALVRVEDRDEKVLLFRSSFSQISERMDDVVKVGDWVCMRLSFRCIFHDSRQWFATVACMDGEDINEAVTLMRESDSSGSPVDYFSSFAEPDSESDSNMPSEVIANASQGDSLPSSALSEGNGGLLYNEPPLKGMMKVMTRASGIITYGECNILINRENFYCNGKKCNKTQFGSMGMSTTAGVEFEAHPFCGFSMNVHLTHRATCAWTGKKPSFSCVASNLQQFKKGKNVLREGKALVGRVIGYYLPDVAFLATGKTGQYCSVALHIADLGEQVQPCSDFICDSLKFEEYVKYKIRKNAKFPLGVCAYDIEKSTKEALKTFARTQKLNPLSKEIKLEKPKPPKIDTDCSSNSSHETSSEGMLCEDKDPPVGSWDSVWGSGEYFKTGVVEVVGCKYVVKFASSKMPDTEVRLDLSTAIKTKQLYCDGEPMIVSSKISNRGKLKSEDAELLEGREISFHVGTVKAGVEVVKCAWIGEYPEILTLLSRTTAAFGRSFNHKWCYEGVIESFPLPTHAVCKVGTLHVHLPLTKIIRDGEMVGVVQSHLKKGDTVLLKLKKEYFTSTKVSCLTSSFCTTVEKLYDDQNVLRVVQGTIVDLPNPSGKIKMLDGSIEAVFDRSAVLAVDGVIRASKIIYAWDKFLTKSMAVGAAVYFSAAKDLSLKSYRAFEVWIGKPPKKNA